jgi:hypothetical protein
MGRGTQRRAGGGVAVCARPMGSRPYFLHLICGGDARQKGAIVDNMDLTPFWATSIDSTGAVSGAPSPHASVRLGMGRVGRGVGVRGKTQVIPPSWCGHPLPMPCRSQSQLAWGEGHSAAWGVVLRSAGHPRATNGVGVGVRIRKHLSTDEDEHEDEDRASSSPSTCGCTGCGPSTVGDQCLRG